MVFIKSFLRNCSQRKLSFDERCWGELMGSRIHLFNDIFKFNPLRILQKFLNSTCVLQTFKIFYNFLSILSSKKHFRDSLNWFVDSSSARFLRICDWHKLFRFLLMCIQGKSKESLNCSEFKTVSLKVRCKLRLQIKFIRFSECLKRI